AEGEEPHRSDTPLAENRPRSTAGCRDCCAPRRSPAGSGSLLERLLQPALRLRFRTTIRPGCCELQADPAAARRLSEAPPRHPLCGPGPSESGPTLATWRSHRARPPAPVSGCRRLALQPRACAALPAILDCAERLLRKTAGPCRAGRRSAGRPAV